MGTKLRRTGLIAVSTIVVGILATAGSWSSVAPITADEPSQVSHGEQTILLPSVHALESKVASLAQSDDGASGVTLSVASDRPWQSAPARFEADALALVEVVKGLWTYWSGVIPPHDGDGDSYVCAERMPADRCVEPLPAVRKGALIGRLDSDHVFALSQVGRQGTRGPGRLDLRINDPDHALYDNRGWLLVRVGTELGVEGTTWQSTGLIPDAGVNLTFEADVEDLADFEGRIGEDVFDLEAAPVTVASSDVLLLRQRPEAEPGPSTRVRAWIHAQDFEARESPSEPGYPGPEPSPTAQAAASDGGFAVDSEKGWQAIPVVYERGSTAAVQVVEGEWTRWLGHSPPHGGEGSEYICGRVMPPENCVEPLPNFPAGALIGSVADEPFGIGRRRAVALDEGGPLSLRINDPDHALYDNRGTLVVQAGTVVQLAPAESWKPSGMVLEPGQRLLLDVLDRDAASLSARVAQHEFELAPGADVTVPVGGALWVHGTAASLDAAIWVLPAER